MIPKVAAVVDTCDLVKGEFKIRLRGEASVVPYDRDRAFRKLSRYLGPDESAWDANRFDRDGNQTRFVKLEPDRIEALDLSFEPST